MIRLKSLLTEDAQFNANEAQKWAENIPYNFIRAFLGGKKKIQWTYDGNVNTYFGDAEGTGKKVIINGVELEAYVPHGFGSLLIGNNVYKGQFVNGRRNGYFIVKYEGGDTYKGQFVNDRYEGNGVYTYKNGETYNGNLKNDEFAGYGVYKWPNGQIYKGNWKNDMRNGYGVLTYSDGRVEKGEWIDGELVNAKSSIPSSGGTTVGGGTNEWLRHPDDNVYVYQQRQGVWWAKNTNNNKEFDISKNPAYKSTIDNLNSAQKNKKLVKV